MKITVVELNPIYAFPPVTNLIRILLKQGHKVNLVTIGSDQLQNDFKNNKDLQIYEVPYTISHNQIIHFIEKAETVKNVKNIVSQLMRDSDILWTTSATTIKALGKDVLRYKNVLQLMELVENLSLVGKSINIPIAYIARNSWRVVVPEINRAFIEQAWWDLDNLPYVLPNKPFDLNCGELSEKTLIALNKIKSEKRKIVLYLGGIYPDRDLSVYAKAVHEMPDYVLYIIGEASGNEMEKVNKLVRDYQAVYLGSFTAPQHLSFVKYAHIGLLPYKVSKSKDISVLNALYCAPNKIYEYSGFGVPMIGSYVPGLLMPFEMYHIGFCCDMEDTKSVANAISKIEKNYGEMSKNCINFYHSTDNENTIKKILSD